MKQGDFLTARTHLLIQTYVIIAVIYVVINYLLGQLAGAVDRRLRRRPGSAGPGRVAPAGADPRARLVPTA